jgi:hypothetical protein
MKKLILCLLLWSAIFPRLNAQVKRIVEQHPFKGTIVSYNISYGIAYELMTVRDGERIFFLRFNSAQGKEMMEKFPVGQSITGISRGRIMGKEVTIPKITRKEVKELIQNMLADSLVMVKSENTELVSNWAGVKKVKSLFRQVFENDQLIFEKRIDKIFEISNSKKAFLLEDKTLLIRNGYFFRDHLISIRVGDYVSSIGSLIPMVEGQAYPITGFSKVISMNLLEKEEGIIESFYFKQNGACIGLRLATSTDKFQLNFPAQFAKEIMEIEKRKEPITIYHNGSKFSIKKFLFPTVHGLISRTDTLRMPGMYYGDPDGEHDYESVNGTGKITKVNFSEKRRILAVIVDDKFLIEIDHRTEVQLRSLLKAGTSIAFGGDQRIKKEGEVYQFNYEIVNPKKLILDGREFLLYSKK